MSYFGSFSNSAFSRDEPYGSSRFSTSDSAWTQNQSSNVWASQPQQQQMQQPIRYEQPRYVQVFDQPTRPLNPMSGALSQSSMFPQYSYMSGGLQPLSSSSFGNNRDRFDDRRGGGGGRDNRQWFPSDERRGGGGVFFRNDGGGSSRRGYNKGGNGGGRNSNGDNRRQNNDRRRDDSEYVPRRVNNGASPKQQKNNNKSKSGGDYVPSRIKDATPTKGGKDAAGAPRIFGKNTERGNNGGGNRRLKPRANKSTDLEFKTIPDGAPSKSFAVKGENLVCFQGLTSVLATQHEFPIVIDDHVYASVDLYYQIQKCKDLTGKECAPLIALVMHEDKYVDKPEKSDSKTYGQLARTHLKEHEVDRKTVEEWRREGGVVATYTAMRAKAEQCSEMRKLLNSSVNQIIVHTYAGDAIFGSGTRVQFVHKWADELAKSATKITIPLEPLSDSAVISMAPQIAQGRNILGLIHMQLADEMVNHSLPFVVTSASLHVSSPVASPALAVAAAGKEAAVIDLSKEEEEDELMEP